MGKKTRLQALRMLPFSILAKGIAGAVMAVCMTAEGVILHENTGGSGFIPGAGLVSQTIWFFSCIVCLICIGYITDISDSFYTAQRLLLVGVITGCLLLLIIMDDLLIPTGSKCAQTLDVESITAAVTLVMFLMISAGLTLLIVASTFAVWVIMGYMIKRKNSD